MWAELFDQDFEFYKIAISVALLLMNVIIIQLTSKVLFKTIKSNRMYFSIRKGFYFFYTILTLGLIVWIWSDATNDITTYVGFISAGIAISLREIFTNIAAWMIILVKRPYELGDRIAISTFTGDVIDIKLFHTVLMEVSVENGTLSTGRIVHLPNNYIFLHGLSNASKGFDYIWNELDVRLTLNSDWEKAKMILEEIINNHSLHLKTEAEESVIKASRKYMLQYNNLTPIVFVSTKEGFIHLTIRFLCEPRRGRIASHEIWQEILLRFNEEESIILG